ncbi:MAG TPA: LysR family transcriptional regulator [Rhodanobacteraceae bacterium]|jgi:DNA-binding transcriptional LysR family regulator|nr:LysR family transcriptional regulator [Rhodanobacteraceae bacterium]
MKRVTLRQLRVFEQVARLRSVSAAAGVCHLTQPAVSMQLKALEQEFELPLTELIGRQLRLTEAGETVAVYARRVQQQLDELDQKLASMRGQQHGKLNVGIVSTAKYFASHMLATFLEEHAGAELSLQVENRAQILRMLGDNEIDIAIMGVPPEFLDAVAVPFADHPHGIVLRGDHALASRSRLQISDFAEDAFLVREPGSGTRAVMERFFASQSFSPRKVIQMTGNEAVKQAVLAGLGVGFLSLNTIGLERGLGLVHVPAIAGLPVMRRWHVVHRRGKQLLPIAKAFSDFVRDEGRRYAEASSSPRPARDPKVRTRRDDRVARRARATPQRGR